MLFSPAKGWTNDPNGLIKIEDTYHLFFQFYPDDIKWGPMHWGHAISKDLVNWEELPTAIYPTEDGYIFSGSAVLDTENKSGLSADGKPALLCFYTEHNPKTGEQQQCIAYSNDYLHFAKYEANPVIKNRVGADGYKKDFRDPKVFVNAVTGGFSMALAAGQTIEFYRSEDLLRWKYSGSFPASKYLGEGICECPDCFFLDGKWVLSFSYIPLEVSDDKVQYFMDRHTMNYFVGSFDGNTFIQDEGETGKKFLDYGPDNYAMVSFFGVEPVTMLGWAENWDYVYDIPADISRGKMTSAREMSLRDTKDGMRLAQKLLTDVVEMTVPVGETILLEDALTVYADEKEIVVTRERIPGAQESRWLGLPGFNCFRADRVCTGDCKISYVRNGNFFELTADEGCISFSINV